jgi:two-component system, NtrC family, response regulator HydG
LVATISTAIKLKKSYNEVDKLRKAKQMLEEQISQPFRDIIGESAPLKEVFSLIDKVAKTDANILILGENGTGKELVARAIHQKSMRKDNSFVAVDMGAITETLFESELFGHKKGSFTDAREDRPGRFELANGGTLFLDEIGNLSLSLQSKLLSALQSRQVTRVGANQPIDVDIRLVCATNMPLHQMVKEGKFRQDLLFCLLRIIAATY